MEIRDSNFDGGSQLLFDLRCNTNNPATTINIIPVTEVNEGAILKNKISHTATNIR